MSSPLVYIVILNYKNYPDTIDCVESVEKIIYPNYRIVIVDNNSGNGSEEILRKEFPHHVFIQTGTNRGYAAGNNAGIRLAMEERADYVLILNNDTIATPYFLEKLVDYAEENIDAGLLGPKIITGTGELDTTCARRRPSLSDYFWRLGPGKWILPRNRWIKAHYYTGEYDFRDVKKVDVISGSCMLIRSRLLPEIGLLDENTFLFLEEFILHERIRRTKYHTVIVPTSRIIHKGHGSVGKRKLFSLWISLKSLRYYLLNHRRFGKCSVIFAISSVGIREAAGILRLYIKAFLQSITTFRNIRKKERRII